MYLAQRAYAGAIGQHIDRAYCGRCCDASWRLQWGCQSIVLGDPTVRWRCVVRHYLMPGMRALGGYPSRLELRLSTRLGTVLRRYESAIGTPYGMTVLERSRCSMVAGEREGTYLQNQRFQQDLAVRKLFLGSPSLPLRPAATHAAATSPLSYSTSGSSMTS